MQTRTAYPRDGLTDDQVENLISGESALTVTGGIEAINMNLHPTFDFSDDLLEGTVSRGSYNTLHGSCALTITKLDLDWPRILARPYITLTSDGVSARFNLGAYWLATPSRDMETYPPAFAVVGYDILSNLADPLPTTYSVNAGDNYLAAIEQILSDRGYVKWVADKAACNSVLPAAKVWAIGDEQITWLTVVNDLLQAIGYQGIWSDWNGRLRLQPYIAPNQRGVEYSYDTTGGSSIIYPLRTIVDDYFATPNRWVAVRQNNTEGVTPVEGNGIYTFDNLASGKTSQAARGRVITKQFQIDAADQASLVTAAQITIDADMRLNTKFTVSTSPNPLHWHFDRLAVTDNYLGENVQVMATDWTLPLNGEDMTHTWAVIL